MSVTPTSKKDISMQPYQYQKELDVFNEATRLAGAATQKYLSDHPGEWYPCGFVHVNIRPARGRFVSMLKDQKVGNVDEFYGGYNIFNPSRNSTQWMYAKEEGARAFVKVLAEHGISARVVSNID